MRSYMMREIIYNEDFLADEKTRIITQATKVDKNENFPEGIEFAIQYLHSKDGEWIQIARIDNQLHKGKPRTHIHVLNSKRVKRVDMSFNEAKENIKKTGDDLVRWLK